MDTTPNFPNGFISWSETHYWMVSYIETNFEINTNLLEIFTQTGHTGLMELSKDITFEFESKYEGVDYEEQELDWYDEMDKFLNEIFCVTTTAEVPEGKLVFNSITGEITQWIPNASNNENDNKELTSYKSADVNEYLSYMKLSVMPNYVDNVDINWIMQDGSILELNSKHRDWVLGLRSQPF